MYQNLDVLIFQNKISKYDIANELGITYNSLLAKLSGKQPLKLDEAFKIQSLYFPNQSVDYLFAKEPKSA